MVTNMQVYSMGSCDGWSKMKGSVLANSIKDLSIQLGVAKSSNPIRVALLEVARIHTVPFLLNRH